VNPTHPPPYHVAPQNGSLVIEVEAADWASLLERSALAVSDAIQPIGTFDTWTARRVAVRGGSPSEILEGWLAQVLDDVRASGFLPALVEVERAEDARASGVVRGGCVDLAARPPRHPVGSLEAGTVTVEPAVGSRPWRARFRVRRAA
jgi:SHS2 domain-containing protein